VISSLAGVTVYFITSEKLLMANSRASQGVNTVVEKRIDELSFYDNHNDISPNSAQCVIISVASDPHDPSYYFTWIYHLTW